MSTTSSLTEIYIEIFFQNGLCIKNKFEFEQRDLQGCFIDCFEPSNEDEMSHRCLVRRKLYTKIAQYVPSLVSGLDLSWFRTIREKNNDIRPCLFEGCKLEFCSLPPLTPEFGVCFDRASFLKEREQFDLDVLARREDSRGWDGWTRREPSDADRLRVNKRGREVLYFFRPPNPLSDVTLAKIKAEICYSLQIKETRKMSLASGPFFWGSEYRDDEPDFFSKYFGMDIVVDSKHMKTLRGAALLAVCEE